MSTNITESDADHTCPNCGVKFKQEGFNEHVENCQRKDDHPFHKYKMTVSAPRLNVVGKSHFLSIGAAGRLYNSGSVQVLIRSDVLEENFTLRKITDAERNLINEIANKYDESK